MASRAEKQYSDILKLAADNRKNLRASDVDRVMSEAHSQACADGFRAWLLDGPLSERTRSEVGAWQPE